MSTPRRSQDRSRRLAMRRRRPAVAAAGVRVERWEADPLLHHLRETAVAPAPDSEPAVAIGSINLDHLHHFGEGRLELPNDPDENGVDWIMLADGAPIAGRASQVTSLEWPRLTGADLLPDILEMAQDEGLTVGFFGGTPESHEYLKPVLAERYPRLAPAKFWAPDRDDVDSAEGSQRLAAEIRAAGVDVLNVALGKPRQELWINTYGDATGARLLLAFGASADFLAGQVSRAPGWVQRSGLEWAFRLLQEPRRLARRYLVQGPPAWMKWRRARPVGPVNARSAVRPEARPPSA